MSGCACAWGRITCWCRSGTATRSCRSNSRMTLTPRAVAAWRSWPRSVPGGEPSRSRSAARSSGPWCGTDRPQAVEEASVRRSGFLGWLVLGGPGAVFTQPRHDCFSAGVGSGGDVERGVLGVVGDGVDVGSAREQELGHAALAAVAGLPERLVDLLLGGWRAGTQEFLHPAGHPKSGGVPQPLHRGAPLDQK